MLTWFDLEHFADTINKKLINSGFVLVREIKETDAKYYAYGDRKDVIRVACSKYGKSDKAFEHPVSACITLRLESNYSIGKLNSIVEMAVGRYILTNGQGNYKYRSNKQYLENKAAEHGNLQSS